MASLADLFNPTFLMFLGILVLVVALLVVYFESKMREQNHKIASMLSLVSTLAEDMNGVKMGLNHLAIRGDLKENIPSGGNLGNSNQMNLIEVSDDEESYNDNDNDNDGESESSESESGESESGESESGESESCESESCEYDRDDDLKSIDTTSTTIIEETKIIKLQVSDECVDDSYDEVTNLEFDETEDLGDFEITNEYVEEVLNLKYDEKLDDEKLDDEKLNDEKLDDNKPLDESVIPSTNDLKTISINLGDDLHQHGENIDYKKLQLPKLRSIAIEKGLIQNSEAAKLKKPDLLKLLGVE